MEMKVFNHVQESMPSPFWHTQTLSLLRAALHPLAVEGGDGAGKETQTRMLVERLRREGYPVQTLDFPRDSAKYGKAPGFL